MCAGCAMVAASAATGFRTWLQTHHFGWLTPKRMRALTIAAMCAAGLVSTVGISGSTTPPVHATAHHAAAGYSASR
ncbi:MAG: hypothetical protein ACHQHO_00820 [Solirubrobacterales bacterium]